MIDSLLYAWKGRQAKGHVGLIVNSKKTDYTCN